MRIYSRAKNNLRGYNLITSKNRKEKMYREIKEQKWKNNHIKITNRRKRTGNSNGKTSKYMQN
jgi:hypothetical protein